MFKNLSKSREITGIWVISKKFLGHVNLTVLVSLSSQSQYFPDDAIISWLQDGRPGYPNGTTASGAAHQASQLEQESFSPSGMDDGPAFKIVGVFCRATS